MTHTPNECPLSGGPPPGRFAARAAPLPLQPAHFRRTYQLQGWGQAPIDEQRQPAMPG